MNKLRKKFQQYKNNKKPLVNPVMNPRYDDIYYKGLESLK